MELVPWQGEVLIANQINFKGPWRGNSASLPKRDPLQSLHTQPWVASPEAKLALPRWGVAASWRRQRGNKEPAAGPEEGCKGFSGLCWKDPERPWAPSSVDTVQAVAGLVACFQIPYLQNKHGTRVMSSLAVGAGVGLTLAQAQGLCG